MSADPQYIVKAVNSGDTLVLLVPNKLPPVEKTIGISLIDTPKLAKKPPATPARDEPYAWEAREFIRKKLIGKTITFHHEYSVERLEREFGQVYLDKENIAVHLVSEGLAEVRRPQGQQAQSDVFAQLEAAQEQAKKGKKGKWSGSPAEHHIRNLIWDPPEDIVGLSNNVNGQTCKVLVEQVINGGLLRALLLPSLQMVSVALTGIQCPSLKGKGQESQPEPFAMEARFFTERAVLNREVNILFEGYDNRNANNPYLYGSIVQGEKCFQAELLERGLAQVVQWSISKTKFQDALKQAETQAKIKQVNKWKGVKYTPPHTPTVTSAFTGRVIQINSGDTITVLRDDTKELVKCTLASCRASKRGDEEILEGTKAQPKVRSIPYSDCAWESRELLRTLLIGKKVNVEVEYVRTMEPTGEKRNHCVVTVDNENVARQLLSNGFAKVAPGPPTERSRHFEEYKSLESEAESKKLGIHNRKEPPPKFHMLDLVKPGVKKCQQHLSFLQGTNPSNLPKHKGIVEVVLGPARYRVYIPSKHCCITVSLTGIVAPSSGRDGEASEPFAAEAMEYARDNFTQRDVEVEVESSDQYGSFLGSIFYQRENIAVSLLKEGLVSTNSNARTRHFAELKAAENLAASSKKNIWSNEGSAPKGRQSKRSQKLGAHEIMAPLEKQEWVPCIATEIIDGTQLYVQLLGDKNKQILASVNSMLTRLDLDSQQHSNNLRVGDIVVARFTFDNLLYRAKVTRVEGDKISVYYIDYGNSEQVGRDRVWSVESISSNLEAHPPQAVLYGLAFLAPMGSEAQLSHEASLCLRGFVQDYTSDRPLLLRVEYIDGMKKKYALLRGAGAEGSAQEHLLKNGLGRIQSKWISGPKANDPQWRDTVNSLHRIQEKARVERLNIWQYGEVVSDDEE